MATPEFMDELNNVATKQKDVESVNSQVAPENAELQLMHISDFIAKYETAVEAEVLPVPEDMREPLAIPAYDSTAKGWMVPGRPDLGLKQTDMPLWRALAKEQGIEIYLKRPEPEISDARKNWVDGPASFTKELPPAVPEQSRATALPQEPDAAAQSGPTKLDPPGEKINQIPGAASDTSPGNTEAGSERKMLHDILDEPPEMLRKRYMIADGHYYYRDRNNAEAFVDKGPGLSTTNNDPVVAASMVEIAQAKGWQSIRVAGSPEFMKEVWFQAQLRGMETLGYTPEPLDLARLEEAKAKGLGPQKNYNNQIEAAEENKPVPVKPAKNPMVGTVVDFGAAPFNFDKREGVHQNFYISLKNEDGGATTHWGKDLARLASLHDLKKGETVQLAKSGKVPVEVNEPVHDKNGKLIDTKTKQSNYNEWVIARLDKPSVETTQPTDLARAQRIEQARLRLDDAIRRGVNVDLAGAVEVFRIEKQHLKNQDITEVQREAMLDIAKDQLAEKIADGKTFGMPGEKPLTPDQLKQANALSAVVRDKFLAEGGDTEVSVDVYWNAMSGVSNLMRSGIPLPEVQIAQQTPAIQPTQQPKIEAPKPVMVR